MDDHDGRVAALSSHIAAFHKTSTPFRCYHGGTTSTRRTVYDPATSIDLSPFTHVLRVDKEECIAYVEPNVGMGALVDATMPHGLIPAVVPEFASITAGGGFAGTAGESSSFRHGLWEDSVRGVEMILADGRVVFASEDNELRDLFIGSAGSFGTLGVLTLLEVRLVPAKPYIEVTYHPVSGAEDAVRKTDEITLDESVGYLDGILFGLKEGVMMAGRLSDGPRDGQKVYTFSKRRDPWYYMHVAKKLRTKAQKAQMAVGNGLARSSNNNGSGKSSRTGSSSSVSDTTTTPTSPSTPPVAAASAAAALYSELIPIRDYFFRYDRAAFWTASYAFRYFYIHNDAFSRWLMDPIIKTPTMLHAAHKASLMNQYIVQDISVPYAAIPEFVQRITDEANIWPLWLCPLKLKRGWPLAPLDPAIPDRIMNVGLWGFGSKKLHRFVEQNRNLERAAKELHGVKCMYAQVYQTEDEFWGIYDRKQYEALREKYGAQALPDVYAKVGKNSAIEEMEARRRSRKEDFKGRIKDVWIFRGVYGAHHMLSGKEFLLKKAKAKKSAGKAA